MAYTTINKSTDYFNTKLWTGNSDTTRDITGVGFQPDWSWVKNRSFASDHRVADAVRGANKGLVPNGTDAEDTSTTAVKSFLSDGIQIGNEQSFNRNGDNHVGWFWKANGAGSANTDGSINTISTSVNTTAGFSISRYTGTGANATVGHGLGAVPQVVIARNITDTEQWTTYHVGLDATAPEDYHVRLNTTDPRVDEASVWNDTAPTSSVFSVGSSGAPNGSGDNHIAYCFTEKTGYSKFGSYTGNGNADGTFVYTGFKPSWVIFKATDSTTSESWLILDTVRQSYNVNNRRLRPNSNNAEDTPTANNVDLLSNGFKIRNSDNRLNGNGHKLIYMAFGQSLVGSNNVPCTAR